MSQPQFPLQPQPPAQPQPQGQGQLPAQTPPILPDKIPDGWLDQIKDILKPKWWTVILGSAITGVVISSAVSYVIAIKTIEANKQLTIKNIEANKQLERSKSQLELQKEAVRSRMVACTKLAQSLSALAMKLEGLVGFLQMAQRSPMSARTVDRIQEQLKDAGLALKDVITARNESLLNRIEFGKEFDDCRKELTLTLAAASQNPLGSLPRIESGTKQLRQLISHVEDQNLREIQGIR